MMIHPHSQAYHLLGLIAVCGELPADAIHRLSLSESYRYKVIASLKSQKLIRLFGRDGIKGYRLTPVAKKLLLQTQPDRFSYYLDAGRVFCLSLIHISVQSPRAGGGFMPPHRRTSP